MRSQSTGDIKYMKGHLLKIFLTLIFLALAGCADLKHRASTSTPTSKETKPTAVEYDQLITVLKPIDNIPISVIFESGVRYRVHVKNTSGSLVKLVWDDSAYVSTSGQSIRLIRLYGSEFPENLHAQQPSSPIAPHSELQAVFSGDRWIELAKEGGIPKPKDVFRKGRIYLMFDIKGKRVDWQGEVAFVAKNR